MEKEENGDRTHPNQDENLEPSSPETITLSSEDEGDEETNTLDELTCHDSTSQERWTSTCPYDKNSWNIKKEAMEEEISKSQDVSQKNPKDPERKNNKYKSDRPPSPPPLGSPNRTALMPSTSFSKKSKQRDESGGKSCHCEQEPSPRLLSHNSASNTSSIELLGNSQRYVSEEKASDKHYEDDRSKFHSKKDGDDMLNMHKRTDSRDRNVKKSRISPEKDTRQGSVNDSDMMSRMKKLYPQTSHKDDKGDHRRQASDSSVCRDHKKLVSEVDKKRDVRELSPRMHESHRDNQYRNSDPHFDKRCDQKEKRVLSPEPKKGKDDRNRDYNLKDRNVDYEASSWSGEHRKTSSVGRQMPEPRGRQESQPSSSQGDRSPDRDLHRKKTKENDLSAISEDSDRNVLISPRRSQSPVDGHLTVCEIEPLTENTGCVYDPDVLTAEPEYAYGYDSLHDPYLNDSLLPADYEPEVIGSSLYSPDVYPERESEESGALIDRYGARDILSPHEILPHREIISLTGRTDALDEDQYGMPRCRRASPEWQRGRLDERDSSLGGHGQLVREQLPQESRSRSPPNKKYGCNLAAWEDPGAHHDNRNENRLGDSQKMVEAREKIPVKINWDGPMEGIPSTSTSRAEEKRKEKLEQTTEIKGLLTDEGNQRNGPPKPQDSESTSTSGNTAATSKPPVPPVPLTIEPAVSESTRPMNSPLQGFITSPHLLTMPTVPNEIKPSGEDFDNGPAPKRKKKESRERISEEELLRKNNNKKLVVALERCDDIARQQGAEIWLEKAVTIKLKRIDLDVWNMGAAVWREEQIVWARFGRRSYWPGITFSGSAIGKHYKPKYKFVFWFKTHNISQIHIARILDFKIHFNEKFQEERRKKTAVLEALQLMAQMSKIRKNTNLVAWAKNGFKNFINRDEVLLEFMQPHLEKIQAQLH